MSPKKVKVTHERLDETERFEVDKIILVCNGCSAEREFYPDVPLRSAEELIEWMNTKPSRCPYCPSKTCDVKARLKP